MKTWLLQNTDSESYCAVLITRWATFKVITTFVGSVFCEIHTFIHDAGR